MKSSHILVTWPVIGLLLLIQSTSLTAQTSVEVEGTLYGQVTWSADTVRVIGDVTMADWGTLTISPGTRVEFQGRYMLEVKGTIIAEGLIGDTIVFTCHPDSTSSGWAGISLADWTGDMHNNDSSLFSHCKFEYGIEPDDQAQNSAGVFYVNGFSKLRITHSVFKNNYAAHSGACFKLYGHANITIRNCLFSNNDAPEGSVIFSGNSDPKIMNNHFIDNPGNPINLSGGSRSVVSNNIISGNESEGIYCSSSNAVISGNIIVHNGTGISIFDSDPVMMNNTICNNSYGLYFDGRSKPNIYNGIIWDNEFQVYLSHNESQPNFYYCDIQGGSAGFAGIVPYTGTYENNIDLDPLFVAPGTGWGAENYTDTADWSLQFNSPCINAGLSDMSGLPDFPYDSEGNPRISHSRIDMGGIEFHQDYVTICGSISNDTTFYADTIKIDCDLTIDLEKTLTILPGTVVEFQGNYNILVYGTIYASGKKEDTICFTIHDTTGFYLSDQPDGGWGGVAYYNNTGYMSNSDSSVFRFCKFQYGKATGMTSGGAIRNNSFSKIRIENCTFLNNTAIRPGGAIFFQKADLLLKNCYFEKNSSAGAGGALNINWGNNVIIENNIFYNNSSQSYGGAVYFLRNKKTTIINNTFSNNAAWRAGAFYTNDVEEALIMNNLVCNNTALTSGGIHLDPSADVTFVNNTVVNNAGGGLDLELGSALIYNSLLRGNQPYQVNLNDPRSQPEIYSSNIEGGQENFEGEPYSGIYVNNLDDPAYFTNPIDSAGNLYNGLNADWSLLSLSSSINSGTVDIPDVDLPGMDIIGNPRIHSNSIDMGAFENQSAGPVITKQPVNHLKCVGDSIVLEVRISGDAFFQWQKNEIDIPGATQNIYKINTLASQDAGNYQCLVSNTYNSISTDNVFLGVRVPPEILTQPGETWVKQNSSSNLGIFALGTELNYQWRKNGIDLEGEITDELMIPQSDYEHEGFYDCIINNACGADTTERITLYLAPQICMVTVSESTGNNLIVWEKASIAPIEHYNIYRESQYAGIYDLLATIPYDDLSVFVDSTADPGIQAYLYKITATDTSEYETDLELCATHKTIHLLATENPETNATQLDWDRYVGFEYGTYEIYRSDTTFNFSSIHSMSSSTSTWADADPGSTTKFYRIAAVKPDACTPTGNTKAGAGPYRHALSNLDDNKLRDTRVADFLSPGVLTVYPNPVSDRATIRFPNPDHETYQLILTDFSGKIMRLIEDISDDTIELSRDGLSAGLYLVELRGPKILRAKIIMK